MARLLLHTSLLISLLLTTGLTAKAQTCRVNIGSSASGAQSYMEVYEYDYVTDKPSFPGGDRNLMTFINATRNYPLDAYRKGIQRRVTSSFVVNTHRSVTHITHQPTVNPAHNNNTNRVLSKMPEWTPGRMDGKPVPVRVVWSVPFRK